MTRGELKVAVIFTALALALFVLAGGDQRESDWQAGQVQDSAPSQEGHAAGLAGSAPTNNAASQARRSEGKSEAQGAAITRNATQEPAVAAPMPAAEPIFEPAHQLQRMTMPVPCQGFGTRGWIRHGERTGMPLPAAKCI